MIVKLGKGGNMFDEHRRPLGRLFYLLAFVVAGSECRGGRGRHFYDQRGAVERLRLGAR